MYRHTHNHISIDFTELDKNKRTIIRTREDGSTEIFQEEKDEEPISLGTTFMIIGFLLFIVWGLGLSN